MSLLSTIISETYWNHHQSFIMYLGMYTGQAYKKYNEKITKYKIYNE